MTDEAPEPTKEQADLYSANAGSSPAAGSRATENALQVPPLRGGVGRAGRWRRTLNAALSTSAGLMVNSTEGEIKDDRARYAA